MKSTEPNKDERINLRLKQSAKQTLERAASFEGQTVSRFILNSALLQAEQTIQEHETVKLNAEDSKAFFDALSTPIKFNEELTAALGEHSRRITNK